MGSLGGEEIHQVDQATEVRKSMREKVVLGFLIISGGGQEAQSFGGCPQ